ncbi:amidohydrolase [Siculibacillus lacustris]|uniref:Amidohydrolase n=1 Tax=Siculibacillus lacustris TaxID=1549641 RepID=A0A4Q9VFT7_9HYPH|nr:amidohydrolase [Siculibacillus lacustris]TBW33800.1 amidohydrolase [Siculibacillus lacustris]
MTSIDDLVRANHDYVVGLRRHFRAHPELSGEEHRTQARIAAELAALGLSPRPIAGTGLVVDIAGGRASGRAGRSIVAVRADMDALPITDEIERDYRSTVPGVCHACGHDGHMAMLLGTAKSLCEIAERLPGDVRLLFQPSEEQLPGGARSMIDEGALDGVSAVLGAHLWQPFPVGTINLTPGRLMASALEFAITIRGRGGHGAAPHRTVDPILVGAQLVTGLRTIIGAQVDAHETAVLTLGAFNAGTVFNVIPDSAELKGTVRVFDAALGRRIFESIDRMCAGLCAASGAEYQFVPTIGYPAVINESGIAGLVAEAAREAFGEAAVREVEPLMGGEDFAYYLERVPGAFFLIGAGNADAAVYPHHHPKFDIDEAALDDGCRAMTHAVLKVLERAP